VVVFSKDEQVREMCEALDVPVVGDFRTNP